MDEAIDRTIALLRRAWVCRGSDQTAALRMILENQLYIMQAIKLGYTQDKPGFVDKLRREEE